MTYFENLPTEVLDAIGIAGFGLYVLNYSLLTFVRWRKPAASAFNGLASDQYPNRAAVR